MWSRALQEFQTLLSHDPHDEDALAGAATAEFQLGQYLQARDYLEHLPNEKLENPELARMYEVSRRVVSLNPFAPGLSNDEKAKRAAEALALAQARASACEHQSDGASSGTAPTSVPPPAPVTTNRQEADWSEPNLRKDPERIEPAMSSVFEMEDAAAERCGEPQGADYALWLIGRGRSHNSR
jgi:tetratricopeptide (TPR) repeat protein